MCVFFFWDVSLWCTGVCLMVLLSLSIYVVLLSVVFLGMDAYCFVTCCCIVIWTYDEIIYHVFSVLLQLQLYYSDNEWIEVCTIILLLLLWNKNWNAIYLYKSWSFWSIVMRFCTWFRFINGPAWQCIWYLWNVSLHW